MRRDFLVGIGLFAAVAAGAGSALAADIPVRPAPPPAAASPASPLLRLIRRSLRPKRTIQYRRKSHDA